MNLKYLIPVLGFMVLAVLFAKALVGIDRGEFDPHAIQSPLLHKSAPEFSAPALDNPATQVQLSDYAGRFVLVNVWGSWCVACRQEHEALLAIRANHWIEIVGVDWKDAPAEANQYLEKLGNPYNAIATDPEGRIAINYGVYGAPESFLISPQGKILLKHTGPMTVEVFKQEIEPIIKAGSSS